MGHAHTWLLFRSAGAAALEHTLVATCPKHVPSQPYLTDTTCTLLRAQGRAVPYKLTQLSTQLKSAVQTIPAPTDGNTERQMSEIEKRKLSTQLGDLQGDQLQGVIDIVQADMANLDTSGDGEIELDMDALPHATLWKLRQFVDGTLRGHRSSNMVAPHKRAPAPTTNGDAAPSAAPKPQQSAEQAPREEPSGA